MSSSGKSTTRSAPPERTPPAPGDRPGPATVEFWFEGRRLKGKRGQSIAAALFANGVRTLSFSVKYRRPRGYSCGRGRCSTCTVEVDGAQGVKACTTLLQKGMRVRRQDSQPWFAPVLTTAARRIPFPSGFYYRFFTRPKFVREAFLGSLRRMAGVGTIDTSASQSAAEPPATPSGSELPARCDVMVVGAGVSGMAAAVAAAQHGASVLLVDEYYHLGGHAVGALSDPTATRARDDLIAAVRGNDAITVALGACVQALYEDRRLMVSTGAFQRRLSADNVILATGAFDAIPLFENNDTPGVLGPRGLRLFLERDRVVPGSRAFVYGRGQDADDAVALLTSHGVAIAKRIDGGTITSVHGGDWVSGARVETNGRIDDVACDLVCAAVPGQPDFTLAQQAGFTFSLRDGGDDLPVMIPDEQKVEASGQRVFLVGETAGVRKWLRKIEHAAEAGAAAARA